MLIFKIVLYPLVNASHTYIRALLLYRSCCCCSAYRGCAVAFEILRKCESVRIVVLPRAQHPIAALLNYVCRYLFLLVSVDRNHDQHTHAHKKGAVCDRHERKRA